MFQTSANQVCGEREASGMKVLDLGCGKGGWAFGFLDAGFDVIGYDIHDFSAVYPGKFIQADLLSFDTFPSADVVVGSSPCTDFTKSGLPASWPAVRRFPPDIKTGVKLFNRFREIALSVSPELWVLENVRKAQDFVGPAKTHYGSRYLWGRFPDFMVPFTGDEYGKWKLPPGPERAAVRSMIPYSLARGMAESMKTAISEIKLAGEPSPKAQSPTAPPHPPKEVVKTD